jgi:hypothetical protein
LGSVKAGSRFTHSGWSHSCERPTRSSPKPRAHDLGARGDERSDAHGASCGPLPPGSNMRHAARALSDRGISDVSLVRAQCPGRGAQVMSAIDGAIVLMCECCRAAVACEKLGVIRSGKLAIRVDTGSPLSWWTEPRGVPRPGARGRWPVGLVVRHRSTTAAFLKTTRDRQWPRSRPQLEISR